MLLTIRRLSGKLFPSKPNHDFRDFSKLKKTSKSLNLQRKFSRKILAIGLPNCFLHLSLGPIKSESSGMALTSLRVQMSVVTVSRQTSSCSFLYKFSRAWIFRPISKNTVVVSVPRHAMMSLDLAKKSSMMKWVWNLFIGEFFEIPSKRFSTHNKSRICKTLAWKKHWIPLKI